MIKNRFYDVLAAILCFDKFCLQILENENLENKMLNLVHNVSILNYLPDTFIQYDRAKFLQISLQSISY